MNWLEALQVFLEVANKKSFAAAAKVLQIPTSKVTRLIQAMESELKIALFVRTTRRVNLTVGGEYLFQQSQKLLQDWHHLYTSLTDLEQVPSGIITIASSPDILTDDPFIEWIAEFSQQYPKICLKTLTIHKPFKLTESEADIFIGRNHHILDSSDVISKEIMKFEFGIYASPDYLKKHKKIQAPNDLADHNCLIFLDNIEWQFKNGKQRVTGNQVADNSNMLLKAACKGLGLVRTSSFRAKPYIDSKKLLPILEKYAIKSNLPVCHICYKKLPYQPQKIKLFIEHILKAKLCSKSNGRI